MINLLQIDRKKSFPPILTKTIKANAVIIIYFDLVIIVRPTGLFIILMFKIPAENTRMDLSVQTGAVYGMILAGGASVFLL